MLSFNLQVIERLCEEEMVKFCDLRIECAIFAYVSLSRSKNNNPRIPARTLTRKKTWSFLFCKVKFLIIDLSY